ncbi:MAG: PD40 domain-containing protein [Candidatus Omnitrophica bacterium]|nr:PD40 domain-containing protein [Candidatus Omnitrophota bacterium]MCB9721906.1 PD40 domain-containing protein [Candidatus Omnitrophota bacterium]
MNKLCMTIAVMALTAAMPAVSQASIEEQVLGPATQGGSFVVSPRGANVAYIGMKGTRLYVAFNGNEGPVLDEIFMPHGSSYYFPPNAAAYRTTSSGVLNGTAAVIFSDDGEHYAYVGRQGDEYIVVHDGQEIARGPRKLLALSSGALTITPKGRQVYWQESENINSRYKWRIMMSGKPGPWSGNQTMKPVFSLDEARYAYVAVNPDDAQKSMLVVDGKDAGYAATQPVFTADGKGLLSVSTATTDKPKPSLLLNGKPVITANSIGKIFPGPVGDQYAVIIQDRKDGYMGINELYMNGKPVPGSDGVQNVWFSADGKHYAAACTNAASKAMYMLVDGKKQNEYQSVSTEKFFWTPDGSHFMYTITSGGRPFLVVDDQEMRVDYLIGKEPVTLAKSGGRYAFGSRDGMNRNFGIYIDGQQVLPQGYYPFDAPVFNGDGSRYGYFIGPVGRNQISGLILDGSIVPDMTPRQFSRWIADDPTETCVIFSPDGKHAAWLGDTGSQEESGIYVDGKLIHQTSRIVYFPAYTPDSKHLFWVGTEPAAVPGQQPPTVLYADGKRLLTVNGYFFRGTQNWDIDENGIVSYLAQDGDQIKRYRVSAPGDYDLARLMAEAESQRAEMKEQAQDMQDQAATQAAQTQAEIQAKAAADKQAALEKYQAEQEAIRAERLKAAEDARKARTEAITAQREAAVAARQKAYEEAQQARKLKLLNGQRARQGLPPLTELPPDS